MWKFDMVGRDFSNDFLSLFMFYTLPYFSILCLLSSKFTLKYLFYIKYFLLTFTIDVVSTICNDGSRKVSNLFLSLKYWQQNQPNF